MVHRVHTRVACREYFYYGEKKEGSLSVKRKKTKATDKTMFVVFYRENGACLRRESGPQGAVCFLLTKRRAESVSAWISKVR